RARSLRYLPIKTSNARKRQRAALSTTIVPSRRFLQLRRCDRGPARAKDRRKGCSRRADIDLDGRQQVARAVNGRLTTCLDARTARASQGESPAAAQLRGFGDEGAKTRVHGIALHRRALALCTFRRRRVRAPASVR